MCFSIEPSSRLAGYLVKSLLSSLQCWQPSTWIMGNSLKSKCISIIHKEAVLDHSISLQLYCRLYEWLHCENVIWKKEIRIPIWDCLHLQRTHTGGKRYLEIAAGGFFFLVFFSLPLFNFPQCLPARATCISHTKGGRASQAVHWFSSYDVLTPCTQHSPARSTWGSMLFQSRGPQEV